MALVFRETCFVGYRRPIINTAGLWDKHAGWVAIRWLRGYRMPVCRRNDSYRLKRGTDLNASPSGGSGGSGGFLRGPFAYRFKMKRRRLVEAFQYPMVTFFWFVPGDSVKRAS